MEVNEQEEQPKDELNQISQQQNQQNEVTETQLNPSQINRVQNDDQLLQEQTKQLDNNDQDNNQDVQSMKQNSVIATPTKTNEHETSHFDIKEQNQSQDQLKQSNELLKDENQDNDENISNQSKISDQQELHISYYNQKESDENNDEIQLDQQQQQNQIEQQQQSRQSNRSNKSNISEKVNNLEIILKQKDELISTLQDEIQLLKQYKVDRQDEIQKIEKKFEEQIDKLNIKIFDLEKILKEKENDLEQYRNGNQTLHLQDLSVISVQKNDNLKSNANEKKDITIFEVLNEKQTTADLSELGNNFWLISAERKIAKNNPLYKDYFPKEPEVPQLKNKVIINHPTKKYDKSYWFKYVELKKNPRYNHHIVLPKLSEPIVSLQNEQNNSGIKQSQQELQQQIIQSIQQQGTFGFSQTTSNKVNQVQQQQSIPFSQKLLANNQKSSSQQQNNNFNKNKMYASQQNILKAQQELFDPEDFLADQEIEQMFAQNNPPKKQQIDWDQQPAKNFLIVQHTNSSQVIEQKEKFPILSQKLSYVNQYSHKREISRINESQNNNRTKILKYQ